MRIFLGLSVFLVGCSKGEVSPSPASLVWGEVNFQDARPADGYEPQELSLQNTGKKALDLQVEGFDEFHLSLGAHLIAESPPTLPTLEPGSAVVITVAVWDYDIDAGERDSEVSGAFQVSAGALREPVSIPWTFTPVRDFGDDTGVP